MTGSYEAVILCVQVTMATHCWLLLLIVMMTTVVSAWAGE